MEKIILSDEAAAYLIAAIAKVAADDYRLGRAGLRRFKSGPRKEFYERRVSDAETFLKSDWFKAMGGQPWMFEKIKAECDAGITRRRWEWRLYADRRSGRKDEPV